MGQPKIQDPINDKCGAVGEIEYPDRPGEPDCIHYLWTGTCGYRSRCRFNHPPYTRQGIQDASELPERDGQPECKELLQLLGTPVLKAEGEAEAFCAQLNREGHVDACITADNDAFLFGAKCVIKHNHPNSKDEEAKQKQKKESWHLKICERIASEPNFPSSEIVDMYFERQQWNRL